MHTNVRKISELYNAHEKSIPEIINRNNQITNEILDNFSEAVKAKPNTVKQMTNRTKDLEESLIDNQDLDEEQITILKMN